MFDLVSSFVMISSSVKSFLMHDIHVVFGRPLGLLDGDRASSKACRAGVSVGKRRRCPSHVSRLFWMVSLHGQILVFFSSSIFEIFFGHSMFRAYLN